MRKLFTRMGKFLKKTNKKKVTLGVIAGITLVAAATWGGAFATTKIAEAKMARDCDNNAIMECGAVNVDEFVKKYKANKTGDLDNIYASAGLSPSEINRFEKTAKMGYVTKSGNVVLGGKVVGTGASSLGRQYMSGSTNKYINGKKYYQRPTSVSFASNSIPALIMMNGDQVEFVSLTSCGNPVWNKPKGKPPIYKCDMLNKEAIPGKNDSFNFSTKVTAANGAKVSKVVYNFGDGTTVTKTNPSEKVAHTYKPGKYTAKVTAYFTVNGETKTSTGYSCETPVEVKTPPVPVYACSALTAQLVPNSKTKYTFTATGKVANGAVLKSGDFDFGDGQKQTGVAANNLTVTAQHDYAKEGTFTATATLNFNVGSTTKTAKCQVTVKPEVPKVPVYACTALSVTQKSRTEFEFKTNGTVENATITGYRYTIRNEGGQVLLTKDLGVNETLAYSQTTPGAYSASGQVIVKVGNETKVTPETANCKKPFEVKPEDVPPVVECTLLTATLKSGTKNTYNYSVSTKAEGKNVKVVSYTYNFGDGQQQTIATPTTSHVYAKAGQYKSTVTVTFEVDGQQVQKTSAACEAQTPVAPEECKPGIPVGDERCQDYCKPGIPVGDERCQDYCKPGIPVGDSRCQEYCKPGVPMGSPECVPTCENGGKSPEECQPKELPATGSEMLGGLMGTSALAGAGYYWRQSRKNLAIRLRRK